MPQMRKDKSLPNKREAKWRTRMRLSHMARSRSLSVSREHLKRALGFLSSTPCCLFQRRNHIRLRSGIAE